MHTHPVIVDRGPSDIPRDVGAGAGRVRAYRLGLEVQPLGDLRTARKGTVLATKGSGNTRQRHSVLRTARKGSVLAMKAVVTHKAQAVS